MVKKRRRLDQFLHSRRQTQEALLQEQTQLSSRLFRVTVGATVVAGCLILVQPPTWTSAVGMGVLFGLTAWLGGSIVARLQPRLSLDAAGFNQFILLVAATVLAAKLFLAMGWSPYLAPLPILGMVVGMAYSQLIALLLVVALSFYLALLGPPGEGAAPRSPDLDFQRAVVLGLGAVVSVLGVHRVRKQSRPVVVGFYAGLVQAVAILSFEILPGDFALPHWRDPEFPRMLSGLLKDPACGLAGGLIAGGVVTSLLPAIERFFGVVTERRLLDLADPSNNLLRVLRERAPGTFQHTLGVQQLARGAAEAIGADALLADVGAYYHDIGKIYKPEYFVENMGEDKSIHDRLRPSMSKMIIISHVKDGILLAKDEKLPQKIIDMIPMHHGTTVVEYFYHKARRESGEEEEAPGTDVEFRYPGPKPRFPEAGILMLADAIEAIAKSMTEPTPNRFRDMVRGVIQKRLLDGQLDECNLTMADLRKVEDSFVRTLTTMYHGRINYPSAPGAPAEGGAAARPEKLPEPIKGLRLL
jgi:putative nucleotidyltransferase with HDIG domain